MAQQIQGGGVVFDEGASARQTGQMLLDAGQQLTKTLMEKRKNAVAEAEQARLAFYDNAQKNGMEPQQYASTVGADDFEKMTTLSNHAVNSDKLFNSFTQAYKADPTKALQNYTDFDNLTEAARMRMWSNQVSANPAYRDTQQTAPPAAPAPATAQAQAQVQAQAPATAPAPPPLLAAPTADKKYTPPFEMQYDRLGTGANPIENSMNFFSSFGDIASGKAFEEIPKKNDHPLTAEETVAQNQFNQIAIAKTNAEEKANDAQKALFAVSQEETKALRANNTLKGTPTPPPAVPTVPQTRGGAGANRTEATNDPIYGNTPPAKSTAQYTDSIESKRLNNAIKATKDSPKDISKATDIIVNSKDPFGLTDALKQSYSKIIPTGDVSTLTVPIATPQAEKTMVASLEKVTKSSAVVQDKTTNIQDKMTSGQPVTNTDWLTFRNALAQHNGNMAHALKSMDPKVANALGQKAIDTIMSMDSVRMEMSGLTDVASRKAFKEGLDNNIKLAQMQLEGRAVSDSTLSGILKFSTDTKKSWDDKMNVLRQSKKWTNDDAIFIANPTMLEEYNMTQQLQNEALRSVGIRNTYGQELSIEHKEGAEWWGSFFTLAPKYKVVGNPAGTADATTQAAIDRQTALGASTSNRVTNFTSQIK